MNVRLLRDGMAGTIEPLPVVITKSPGQDDAAVVSK